jgi:CRISPR-associated protein Csm1
MHNTNWLPELRQSIAASDTLYSVLGQVNIGRNNPSGKERLVPRTLRVDASFLKNERGRVEEDFETDVNRIKALSLEADDYTVFHLAQKYGWRTAAAQNAEKGVSGFDDLRIEEAIAACGDADKYLLIKGDLTGIQDFIEADINLDIVGGAKNIAKRLRGKSFFVSAITDFLAESLLSDLNLPVWNLLFAGGGHFNLLAPDNDATRQAIKSWEKNTQTDLTQQLGGRLGLVLAVCPCEKDLLSKADAYFELLNRERDRQKYRKASDYLSVLFYPAKGAKSLGVKDFEAIGEVVPKYDFMLSIQSSAPLILGKNDEVRVVYEAADGNTLCLVKNPNVIGNFILQNSAAIEYLKVLSMNDTDFLPVGNAVIPGKTSYGFKLVGKETPKFNNGELKDFEEICEETTPEGKARYEMMSVMRLDVDDLGCIFSKGMKPAGLKQVVALSREMSFFFSGYFNHLAKLHKIYVVYSGGDDAFVVGHWYNMLHFARLLQTQFQEFAGKNPNIHFSAGIFTCDAHYPVGKFAEDSKTLLDEDAKKHPDKNRLSVFNHQISWKHFGDMLDFGEKVVQYSAVGDQKNSEKLARSIINRVLTVVKNSFYEKTELDENKNIAKRGHIRTENFYRNFANLKYLFARQGYDAKAMAEKGHLPGTIESDVIRIIVGAFNESKNNDAKTVAANDLRVALNYALYNLREPDKK